MKTRKQLEHQSEQLKKDIRERIRGLLKHVPYEVKVNRNGGNCIDFYERDGVYTRIRVVDVITNEGSNIGIYPRDTIKYIPHSENSIENIHDLFLILSILEENINLK